MIQSGLIIIYDCLCLLFLTLVKSQYKQHQQNNAFLIVTVVLQAIHDVKTKRKKNGCGFPITETRLESFKPKLPTILNLATKVSKQTVKLY